MFTRAIVRPPGASFASGLTSAHAGAPDVALALEQHRRYCEALRRSSVGLHSVAADEAYPDGSFVEDTAVLAGNLAVLTRPGAPSRRGEVASIAALLRSFDLEIHGIAAPGTVDGGDVAQADRHFFIGISGRTNLQGARQLSAILTRHGHTTSLIDVTGSRALLHLKSGLAYLGEGYLVVTRELAALADFKGYALLQVPDGEEYAANCVRVNDYVLLAAGYPRLAAMVEGVGYAPIALEMSEFSKMDGGLSCLSLRF